MPLKHRPTIRLMTPRELRPGMEVEATVVLETKRELRVESVDVRVRGEQWVVHGSANHQSRSRAAVLPALEARVSGATTLPRGRAQLPFRFKLPEDALSSYRGRTARVEYIASVHVDIDWWPDARRDFELVVSPLPIHRELSPRLYSTAPDGPRGLQAELDISLASDVISPGDTLLGTVAVARGGSAPVREIVLSLVGSESRFTTDFIARPVESQRLTLRLPVPEKGVVAIRMLIPANLPPSLQTALFELTWALEVKGVAERGRDPVAVLPLTIVPAGSTEVGRAHYTPPTLGDERVHAIWSSVGEKLGMARVGDVLERQVDEVHVTIRRELRGKEGAFVVAELHFPSLHIDLDGGAASSFRRVIGGGVLVGRPQWDQSHYITGREPAQVMAFIRALPETLFTLPLEDVDDTSMRIAVRQSSDQARAIEGLARPALVIANAIATARRAIPSPISMKSAVVAWRKLAKSVNGELELARMAVRGVIAGMPVRIVTEWTVDQKPRATHIVAEPETPLDETTYFTWSNGAFAVGDASRISGEARLLLDRLSPSLVVVAGMDGLSTDLPAPLLDPTEALDVARSLVAIAHVLATTTGPYR